MRGTIRDMQAGKVRSFVALYWGDFSARVLALRPAGPPAPAQPSAQASASCRATVSAKEKRRKFIGPPTAIAWRVVALADDCIPSDASPSYCAMAALLSTLP